MNNGFHIFRKVFLLVAGALSLVFFGICLAFSHIGVSWLWLWPLITFFCLVRFLMLQFHIRLPKWLGTVYYTLLLLFLAAFVLVEGRIVSAMQLEAEPGLDYVITLGAAVRDGLPTTPLLLRIQKTAEYLNENPDTLAIASGGQGASESMSEARCIQQYLMEYGIAENRILLEDQSADTEENIRNSFAMIPDGASVGVISNNFHIYRAMRVAELQGHTVSGIPAKSLLPLGIHYTVREFFAVVQLELEHILYTDLP